MHRSRTLVAVTLGSLACSIAAAAPSIPVADGRATLPSGLVLETRNDHELIVHRGKQVVQLFAESPDSYGRACPDGHSSKGGLCGGIELSRVDVADDGAITVDLAWGGSMTFRPGELDARLDVAVAAKQSRAAAIATLEHALVLDPKLWAAGRALAILQIADHHRELGAATIAALLRGDIVANYDLLVRDARLSSLIDQPAIAALRAPKPGTLRLKAISTSTAAWSATLGMVVEDLEERIKTTEHAGYDETDHVIAFQAVDTDDTALTLPVQDRAHIERLLRDFDFRVDPAAEMFDRADQDSGDDVLRFAHSDLVVKLAIATPVPGGQYTTRADPAIRIVRDDKELARSRCTLDNITGALWLPAASVVVVTEHESGTAGIDRLCVIRVPR